MKNFATIGLGHRYSRHGAKRDERLSLHLWQVEVRQCEDFKLALELHRQCLEEDADCGLTEAYERGVRGQDLECVKREYAAWIEKEMTLFQERVTFVADSFLPYVLPSMG